MIFLSEGIRCKNVKKYNAKDFSFKRTSSGIITAKQVVGSWGFGSSQGIQGKGMSSNVDESKPFCHIVIYKYNEKAMPPGP